MNWFDWYVVACVCLLAGVDIVLLRDRVRARRAADVSERTIVMQRRAIERHSLAADKCDRSLEIAHARIVDLERLRAVALGYYFMLVDPEIDKLGDELKQQRVAFLAECSKQVMAMANYKRERETGWTAAERDAYFGRLPGDARLVAGLDPEDDPTE